MALPDQFQHALPDWRETRIVGLAYLPGALDGVAHAFIVVMVPTGNRRGFLVSHRDYRAG